MKWIFLVTLALVPVFAAFAEEVDSPCVRDSAVMPVLWRPPAELEKSLNPAPWAPREANDAERAFASAADEMIAYFDRTPASVERLWDDSIEALIQQTHASANKPAFDARLHAAARKNLAMLIDTYRSRPLDTVSCDEFEDLLPLALFAHRIYPFADPQTHLITTRANAAIRTCGSLKAAVGVDLSKILAEPVARRENIEDLFDVHLWSLWLIEAELYPDIALPAEARVFGPAAWHYFATLGLADASAFKDGARDDEFGTIADLATHIAHIPTGTHRFPLYIGDSPNLYRFHRENFYAVLQASDLDLIASFVDSLRQYGCTPDTDAQVRDGSRYLLKAFHDANDRWMLDSGDREDNSDLDDYDLIHRPWTAALGLRDRRPELPRAGTYGGLVRRWLLHRDK